jgi:hypothetical protein
MRYFIVSPSICSTIPELIIHPCFVSELLSSSEARLQFRASQSHLRDLERRLAAISAIVVNQEDSISELSREAEELIAQCGLAEVDLAIQASISDLRSRFLRWIGQEKEVAPQKKRIRNSEFRSQKCRTEGSKTSRRTRGRRSQT